MERASTDLDGDSRSIHLPAGVSAEVSDNGFAPRDLDEGGEGLLPEIGPASGAELAEELSVLVQRLHRCEGPEQVLTAVAGAAAAMTGADEVSIRPVLGRGRSASGSRTGELADQLDAIQAEVRQGPGLDAVSNQRLVRADDLAADARWPAFTQRTRGLGPASVVSVPLVANGAVLGALNLYGRRTGAFSEAAEQVGSLIAVHAAIAYATARERGQLAEAVRSRDVIGQAKGIVSERFSLDGEAAFRVLVKVSQHTNRKLHDVAAELVEQRTIAGFSVTQLD